MVSSLPWRWEFQISDLIFESCFFFYIHNIVSGKTVDEYKRWSDDNKVLIAREGPGLKANFQVIVIWKAKFVHT